jgi:hypothetical protein
MERSPDFVFQSQFRECSLSGFDSPPKLPRLYVAITGGGAPGLFCIHGPEMAVDEGLVRRRFKGFTSAISHPSFLIFITFEVIETIQAHGKVTIASDHDGVEGNEKMQST